MDLHEMQSSCIDVHNFSHSDSTEKDITIVTVCRLSPYPSLSPANWLMGLLDPNHGSLRHLPQQNSSYTFSFYLHLASSTPGTERKVGSTIRHTQHVTQTTKLTKPDMLR